MKKEKIVDLVWSICLLVVGVSTLIYSILNIANVTIPHSVRITIAVMQIILGSAVIITSVIKLRKSKNK